MRRLSPTTGSQRFAVAAVAVVLGVVAVVALLARVLASPAAPVRAAAQDRPGPVLLVPGYGGSTAGLEVLARELRAGGRDAQVVPLPGDGRGDLRASAEALRVAAEGTGAGSVDVVGYSAGGVVARLWAREHPERARRVVTLGSPHHGTRLAALGAAYSPAQCPVACQQLVPGSDLLEELNDGDETPDGPRFLALWTTQDETVTPPDSGRLEGAVNVALQSLCPGVQVSHAQLPTDPVVTRVVQGALAGSVLAPPTAAACG